MLHRIKLTLSSEHPLDQSWAYRLYGSLLEQLPPEYGDMLHQDGRNPVSQYLEILPGNRCRWVVTLFGEDMDRCIAPVLLETSRFSLRRGNTEFRVLDRESRVISHVEELFSDSQDGQRHRLTFVSPTAFRQKGYYRILPEPRLILQSSIRKWNCCFPQCPIEDAGGGLESMAEGLVVRDLRLISRSYTMKGQSLPGFVGTVILDNHLGGFHRTLANALLEFSGYGGIGIKTTLGMGGTEHQQIASSRKIEEKW